MIQAQQTKEYVMKKVMTVTAVLGLFSSIVMAGGWEGPTGNKLSTTSVTTSASMSWTNTTGIRLDLASVFLQARNMTNGTLTLTQEGATVNLPLVVTGTTAAYVVPNSNIPVDKNAVLAFTSMINTSGTGQANVTNANWALIYLQNR
jgi:hypothetical protein